MTNYSLKAQVRTELGKKAKKLLAKDLVPAVLYGHGIDNKNLAVKKNELNKIYAQAGESQLIDLQIDDAKPVKALIYDLQADPRLGNAIHVDFYQIREDEKLKTHIKLEFINEAPAVKELGGVLVKNFDELEIECLPKDLELISHIKVDLSALKTYSDAIHVKDLSVPKEIKILTPAEEVVALVSEVKEEVVVEQPKTIEEVEVIKKEKAAEEGEGEAEKAEAGKPEAKKPEAKK